MTRYAEPKVEDKLQEFMLKLNSLDFGPLAYKLMNAEDRPGLSFEQTIDAIKKYKGFLALYHANEGKTISPSRYIDYVWHTHIMDTELYTVQTAILFGHYLHHFPFFGKRNDADEGDLLAAADFTKSQALKFFGWDDDDWCGTGRKPGPRPGVGLTELVNVLFPAGFTGSGMSQAPDSVTIQAGNFRHTLEYFSPQADALFSWGSSRLDYLARYIKLPIWVIVCKPAVFNVLNEISVIRQTDKLMEVSRSLVANRMSAEGFSAELVNLQPRG